MNRSIMEILGTVAVSAVAIAAGAFGIDWLKSTGRWPAMKPATLPPEKDPVAVAGEKL